MKEQEYINVPDEIINLEFCRLYSLSKEIFIVQGVQCGKTEKQAEIVMRFYKSSLSKQLTRK